MKPRTRTTVISIAVAAAYVAALGLAGYFWATGLQKAAEAGKAQAEAGAKNLAAQDATAAAAQFGAASRSFARAQAMLGPDWLGSVANVIPQAGRQYSAARTLVAIGVGGSTAGMELAAALREAPDATTTAGPAKFGVFLSSGRTHIDRALVALSDVADRSTGLTDDGLVPPLAKAVRSLKTALADVAPFLGRTRGLLALERYLLSTNHRILVVAQNNAELRPTGGFAGSFGIVNIGPNGLELEKYADVYTLPDVPGTLPKPAGNRFEVFAFRDANWWLDFPTSARAMLTFWRDYRQPPVDGIIAIDVVAIRDLLEVFGPIRVPSYSETFTADNLLGRLLYLIEVKSNGGPTKKDVLVALANELEQRTLSADPQELSRSALALAKAADAKHVQLYFTDAKAEAAVTALGWSGALTSPPGTTDLLAVSNTMNWSGKVNVAMKKTIDYKVALQVDGSADTTLVLGYANTAPFNLPGRTVFGNYLRVQRAPGTFLSPSATRPADQTVLVETGLPTVAREFLMRRGRIRREKIATRVPAAWRAGQAPAALRSPIASGAAAASTPSAARGASRYRLFVVRQADLQDIPTTITITPPAGWRISSARAWRAASGEALVASWDEGRARLALPLSGDLVLDVGLEPR